MIYHCDALLGVIISAYYGTAGTCNVNAYIEYQYMLFGWDGSRLKNCVNTGVFKYFFLFLYMWYMYLVASFTLAFAYDNDMCAKAEIFHSKGLYGVSIPHPVRMLSNLIYTYSEEKGWVFVKCDIARARFLDMCVKRSAYIHMHTSLHKLID